ncbi:MAG TPA: CHAP domain-containing protein [Acetobacteraceae bacterium]|jgi:surface antigen|nr:CHAP domain-containing protein [Acetobacteraceae bacterium]
MGVRATGGTLLCVLYSAMFGLAVGPALADTEAQRRPPSVFYGPNTFRLSHLDEFTIPARPMRQARYRSNTRYATISCVPYVRSHSAVKVAGNAWQWWANAAGSYARGNVPEMGSVLVFQSNRQMHLGHVAVVSHVRNPRMIEIDQSNWPTGQGVTRHVPVVDVSERNDWTAVRVALRQSGKFGSIYPTYGFIYARPDTGRMIAATLSPAPTPPLDPAPSDLRSLDGDEQIAEAPAQHSARPRHPGTWASGARRGNRS